MKKKIAMLCLMTILLSLVITGPAAADEDSFTISCEADRTYYIPDRIEDYPILVTVKNNGNDFEGTLKLMLYAGSQTEETIAYGRPAAIQAGKTETFQFNIKNVLFDYDQGYRIPVRIDLLDENGHTVYQTLSSFMAVSDGYDSLCAGIISRDTRISQEMDSVQFEFETIDYGGYGVSGMLTMHGIDLTSEMLETIDLSRLPMMVIEENISEKAWQNVSEWLISGKYLLISRPVYDKLIHKPLDNQKMTTYGRGRVLVYERGTWSATMLQQSVRTLFGQKLGSYGMDWQEDYWYLHSALSYDIHSPIPDFRIYLIGLILYIIVTGPVCYLLLKKKDRREYLWAVIPCMALVFGVVLYYLNSPTRYTGDFMRYNAQVWLTDEAVVENTSMAVVSPDKGKVVFTADKDSHLSLVSNTSYWYDDSENFEERQASLLDKDYDAAIADSENKTDVLLRSKVVFQEEYLTSSRIFETDGRIVCDLKCCKGGYSGTVANQTPWDLNNCFVLYKGLVLLIGDLPAGQSIALDLKKADVIWNNMEPEVAFDTSAYRDINEKAAQKTMNHMLQLPVYESNEQAVVGGFTSDYDIGIDDGQLTFIDGMTLISECTDITFSGDDWKSQAIVYGEGCSVEDRDNYDASSHYVYGTELELCYQLDKDYQLDYLEWINSDQQIQVSFYNYETDSYERVLEDAAFMERDALLPYVNARNVIKARITVEQTDENHFILAFTTSGGKKHD